MSTLRLGDKFPDFEFVSTAGKFSFHAWASQKQPTDELMPWFLFFSHPADFTPVCTTEISQLMRSHATLRALNLHPIGLSVNSLDDHHVWNKHLAAFAKDDYPTFPLIADPKGQIASTLGMLDSLEHDPTNFTNGIPLTVRCVFVLDHRLAVRACWTYPAAVGRSWEEIFRTVKALQLSEKYPIATPENWTSGQKVLIRADMTTEAALSRLPKETTVEIPISDAPYVRFVELQTENC